ncbi:MAG TPA: hypothetical protein VLT15_12620, partial [Acidimicrobiia bacterium]|nr:hypothetical protein [Acidimicrobiia bacterium]
MAEIPEELLRRSAEARAAATGLPFDEVYAEMLAAVGGATALPVVETAPPDAEPEHPTRLPEDLLDREAEARAKALGVSKEDAVAELKGEKKLVIPASEPQGVTPAGGPEPESEPGPAEEAAQAPVEAAPASAPAPVPEPASSGELDYAAAAGAAGMPEKLFRRSVEAKAKAKGVDPAVVLAEMTGAE